MTAPTRGANRVGIAALPDYRDRLDARSPAEFALDHLPGAISAPVLSDAERAQVGTLSAQASSFEARKVGAALVARNIAALLETLAAGKPRDWAPLVYCWRGGQRSRSFTHVLNEVGFAAVQLEGGYRAWRRHVVERLATLPAQFTYRVVCGLTGSGKSRLLAALAHEAAQVLDLEGMARHRGSLLGDLPHDPQPTQKRFETLLFAALEVCDPARPIFVESESRRIGSVQVPEALLAAMRASACIRVATSRELRIALLKDEYAHFLADPIALGERLAPLIPLHGRETIARWTAIALAGEFDVLVGELLDRHYDPTYTRAIDRNFPRQAEAIEVAPDAIGVASFRTLARELIGRIDEGARTVAAPA